MMKLTSRSCTWTTVILFGLAIAVGAGRALAQRPLGTDVSGYQPSINWMTVKNAGVAFAWAKATEGTGYTNPYFTTQEAGAQGVGIYIGAYHFSRPSLNPNIGGANSADSEAAYFWSVAGNYVKYGGSYLVPMLDWEDTGATVAAGFTAATMSAWVNEWCNAVSNYARLNGVILRPVVYTGTWYSRPGTTYPGLTTAVTSWPSWIAAYPSNPSPQTGAPSDTYPWPTWNIWQYADTNWSGGDADVFNGNLAGFVQTFVVGGTNAPLITTEPANLMVEVDSNATFSVKASGQAPLSFQWLFNGSVIPGATSSNYTVNAVQLTNAGGYAAMVGNSYASVPSSTAFLSVLSQLTNPAGSILGPPSMVNWWPAEGNPNDIFGSNNATPHNGFAYAAGKQGLAFHFDGLSGYLSTGAGSIPVPWTACMWVNRQNAPGPAAALSGDGNYELKLEQYNGTRQAGFTTFGVADYNFGYTVPQNTWTHLAFVASGTQMQLYANGALVGTITTNIPLPRAYVGAGYVNSPGRLVDYMLGNLDEVMLFNRALTSSEISAIWAAGGSGLVRAPEFTGMQSMGNGQFQLNLRGQTGKNFTIYTSRDLATWTFLTSSPNPSGGLLFMDNSATNALTFYRASQP
ncbi:MAG TPA: GH25 family lysozyme [Candidatus Acidoferrum sp.]|nr:GH25 family lysozyme [Candidatus Acidoferrum sp.]